MVQCCVPLCKNRNDVDKGFPFYRFPVDDKVSKKWLELIRRDKFTPTTNTRICGWHFPNGKEAGPTRFAWNEGKAFQSIGQPAKQLRTALPVTEEDEAEAGPCHLEVHHVRTTELLQIDNVKLKEDNLRLHTQLENQKQTFSFDQISSMPRKVFYYTGLPDAATVFFLDAHLSKFPLKYNYDWTVQIMPLIDQLLLTLMKLRLNCGIEDLSTRFNCSRTTVTNIFLTISSALHDILYVGMMEGNIPSRFKNQTSLPECFLPFPNCRIVLDCTEVAICNNESLDNLSKLYSHYKGCTTLKALVGVAPNGVMTFVSDLYGGSISDKAITADSGVLEQLVPGDMVIADKGFTIRNILPEGVSLNIPTFLVDGQFTLQQVHHNRLIARVRVHVERSIQRLKTFRILKEIPHQYQKHANKILKACVCLMNLQTPILREVYTIDHTSYH
ncbi:uncharacterized protein LOC134452647 [Engraulis encrasicolus]|uniref:uncharacterized protein LOC134452647 n=1 Tax=Engraulis encrasicolus TaxID=184585 RepID=UPI002FCE6BC7